MRSLSLSLIAVVLVATIGLGWLFDTLYFNYLQEKDTTSIDRIMSLEKVSQNLANSISNLQDKQRFIEHWQGDYALQMLLRDELPLPEPLTEILDSGLPLTLESDELVTIHTLIPNTDSLLLLSFPQRDAEKHVSSQRYWLTSLFYVLLIGIFLIWLTPLLLRLLTIRKVTRAFGEGHLSQRLEVGSISYIRDVEIEFNRMAQRLEDLIADVKLLSSAVSHDLRTPLAKLRMGLDTLSEETDPAVRVKYHQRLDSQLDHMVELVETLLQYARMDQAMIELQHAPIKILPLLQSCIAQQSESIEFICPGDATSLNTNGDSRYIKIAINNVIQNALKYQKTKCLVELSEQHDHIVLRIEDDGDGVPVDQRERIFKPFIRADKQSQQGFGVGLAITKRVLDWHQATIEVDDSEKLHGSRFTIKLKKAR